MGNCPECGEGEWPQNFEPVLKRVGGCPACEPEAFRALPE